MAAHLGPIGHSTDARIWTKRRRLRAMSSAGHVQCPILVGRDDLLELFDQLIAEANAGRGSAVFLSGRAGLGKTRLMRAAARKAEAGFSPPLDIIDGAARIVDPVFVGRLTGENVWGQFLKDYKPAPW